MENCVDVTFGISSNGNIQEKVFRRNYICKYIDILERFPKLSWKCCLKKYYTNELISKLSNEKQMFQL